MSAQATLAIDALRQWPVRRRDSLPLALWDADAVADATGGTANAGFQVSGVEMDSRDVRPGDLFVALKGEAMDGHKFIDKAFAAGAAAAIVDRPVDWPHVLVKDTTAALHALAAAAIRRADAVRIGVTGSVGKTGVKEAIFAALDRSSRGAAHRSVRSYNNHVGVPLSLARMQARSRFGIFEMGMNHAGELSGLTQHVRPHVAVITTIAPAHIENLGSEEAIADAKAEIFEGLEKGGTAVIPADSPHFERLLDHASRSGARTLSFGRADHADVRLLDAIPSANGGSLVTAQMGRGPVTGRVCFTVAEPGEHWISNALCVMAAVQAAGGDLAAAGLALAEMGGLKGRGARHRIAAPGGHALVIDESYNANPASMRATLRQLGQTPATRRVAVLGSMKELGDFAPRFHADLAEPLAEANVDLAILVGEEMRSLASQLHRNQLGKSAAGTVGSGPAFAHCDGPAEAIGALEEFGITAGDAVLVKGSNSIGLGRVVDHFTRLANTGLSMNGRATTARDA
ncbi:UDP-N-acetylmuramoyl-tripeptide--D-alanyl-D-alanine ligase [Alteripontixanthobacter maritimus]|uniref:UDP-N-acetylmuramoyl-tripeptide--D-alanyl-D-alanine ligase n=1 Tax=Alteripontixanthobacter maritimus TaxID=2161824 RepID=A0A369Q727_9SPHN|nr:UDP-N-acetylmuramoyl-tripeptide--D-alanyl-D-alanine ligase [Alteripontixanthobacter maritimus]RDC59345.1 UDP-N-acetylmuramoyl-tripeptide--D-alanyl-D-alanine ligase [Alteripontixanthobacter maritimus]